MEKIDALNILTNINCDTSNLAAGTTPVKSESSGKFRFFMHAAGASAQGAEQSVSDNGSFTMLNILSKNQLGEMLNIKAKISDIGGENEEEDSRCFDLELQKLVEGIVGIIEGFGLLDYNMEESVIDEISDLIASVADIKTLPGETDAGQAEYIKQLSDIIARMPNAENNEAFAQEAQEAFEKIFGEYQCSFDNTNSTGVKVKVQIQETGVEKATEKPGEEPDAADRIKLMIKAALRKSAGTEAKKSGLTPGKDSDEVKNNAKNENKGEAKLEPEAAKPNAAAAAQRTAPETSDVSRPQSINQSQSIEQTAQNDMDENVIKIADKIVLRQTEGKNEFDVSLKPSFLGKLSIKLTMESDGIKAHIKAADQYVKGLISEQLPELSQALKEKGVNMSHIEVVYESPMQTSADRQFNGQNQNMGHAGKSFRIQAAGEGSLENIAFGFATGRR